ncbi:MAG: LysM peptidoglycan-binding domain-containing protein [Deltaproteobacteria bacterium]|nr:LysM peptidoglycan-binding domain-containing protein [Deltaproteobacteria bacterium]
MKRLVLVVALALFAPAAKKKMQAEADPRRAPDWNPTTDTYVVQAGDTLWDISARVVGSPWHWPKVWSYNPEITNPHWIYPGDNIRFVPSQMELPAKVELIADQREIPSEDVEAPQVDEPPSHPTFEVVDTTTGPGTRAHAPRTREWRRFAGLFVTPKELAESGTLTNAAEDKALLSKHDSVFLSFPGGKQPKGGDKYMVYRTLGAVMHPVTHRLFGYMTQVTALAAIRATDQKASRAELIGSVVEVERGQYVTPLVEDPVVTVSPTPAKSAVEGVVLAIQFDGGVVAGEQQIIFVDKGSKDGLSRGNQLDVRTQGDPLTGAVVGLPETSIATVMVVQATDDASTCLVVKSTREIEAGYKVVAMTKL